MSFAMQLTNAGAALLNANTGPITLTSAVLGSDFNYIPEATDTNIHGTAVFTTAPGLPASANANLVLYTVYLDYEVGPFNFGEIGFFTADGTLFALGAGNTLIEKLSSSTSPPGNSVRLDCYISMVGQNYQMWLQLAESNNDFRVAVLGSPDYLPQSAQATPNVYVISGIDGYQSSFFAYTDQLGLWNFDAYAYATQATATVTAFDNQSVTIALSQYVPGMSPAYLGDVILEFVTGSLYSICRYVSTAITSDGFVTLGFDNPLMETPIVGDQFVIFSRQASTTTSILPIASANQLGVVQVGSTLTVTSQGLLNVNTSIIAVNSVNGQTGAVVLTASDISGLATVATSGSYLDLTNKPAAYTLPVGSLSVLGGVMAPSDGSLTINSSGVIEIGTLEGYLTTVQAESIYAPLANPILTGVPQAPTAALGTATAQLATTAFVQSQLAVSGVTSFNTRTGAVVLSAADINTALNYTAANAATTALIASPTFTGVPAAPTAAPGTNTTQLATTAFVMAAVEAGEVTSFNTRTGDVVLTDADVVAAIGFVPSPIASPTFTGVPSGPTAQAGTNTTQFATTQFVQAAVEGIGSSVTSFNTRAGAVTLQASDVTGVGGALLASPTFTGTPAAPTATSGTNTTQLATTAFVQTAIGSVTGVTSFNTRSGAITLSLSDVTTALAYTPANLVSPTFTGVPLAPTATSGTDTTQIATTAFVTSAITAVEAAVVTSFNTRSGAVVLTAADVSGVNGALLASPIFTGTPEAPTAAPGTNTTQLATTAFVEAAVSGSGVLSFNTRTGAVVLTASDVTGVGGALLASPAFTGTPTAPTPSAGNSSTDLATTAFVALSFAPIASPTFTGVPAGPTATPGTNTTQLATTAFVEAAVTSGSGVTSFNTRTGAVNLSFSDVTGALTYTPANLMSPTFTGIPQAPTAANGTNSVQLATCAFVLNELSSAAVTSFNTRTGAVTLALSDVTGVGGAPIASPSFTGRVQTVASSYTVVALGSVSGTQTLNLVSATEWTLTITGATTFAFTNTLAAGQSQIICLRITNGGSSTISWPSGTQFANGGTAPSFTASGVDLIAVRYDTTSSTYMVFVIGLNIEA